MIIRNDQIEALRELAEDLWQYNDDPQVLPRMVSGWKPTIGGVEKTINGVSVSAFKDGRIFLSRRYNEEERDS